MRDKLLMRIELWRNALGRILEHGGDYSEEIQRLHHEMTATLIEAAQATPRYRKQAQKMLEDVEKSPDARPDVGGPHGYTPYDKYE